MRVSVAIGVSNFPVMSSETGRCDTQFVGTVIFGDGEQVTWSGEGVVDNANEVRMFTVCFAGE